MADSRSESKKVWKYAVVLFTSALMVLMIAGYSQIKLNRNVSEYEKQLKLKSEESQDFEMNLNSALQTNRKLSEQLKELKKELEQQEKDNDVLKSRIEELEKNSDMTKTSYKLLLQALKQYNDGKITESALTLQRCNTKYLDPDGVAEYNRLVSKTFSPASKEFYSEGRELYNKGNYSAALDYFLRSLNFSTMEYFSDDAYFYAAICHRNLGNREAAKKLIMIIIEKYPQSTYRKEANRMLGQLN